MKGTVIYGPRDIRFEDRADPTMIEDTLCELVNITAGRLKSHRGPRAGPVGDCR